QVAIFHADDVISDIHALKLRIEQRAKCAVIRLSIMNPRDCTDSSFPVADTPIRNYKETTECPQRTRLENKFWKQLWPGRMERIDCLPLREQPTSKSWRVVIRIRSTRHGLSWWGQLLRMGSFIGRSLRLQWLPKRCPNEGGRRSPWSKSSPSRLTGTMNLKGSKCALNSFSVRTA